MKKIIIAPDKYKGTLSSIEICEIIEGQFKKEFDGLEVVKLPIADGGDGTAHCFLSREGAKKMPCIACDPFGQERESYYVMLGDTAIIEMALYAGLALVGEHKDPMTATTYGVGQAALQAIKDGAKKVVFALGGSATNDMACGLLCALGMKFYDKNSNEFIPTGGTLEKVEHYDVTEMQKNTAGVKFEVMCDIDNPLYGPNGAAYVFAPQKGADRQQVQLLDKGLEHMAKLYEQRTARDISGIAGAGAAGGMGGGLYAFLGARLRSGIDTVLEIFGFDSLLDGCDLVITGEGKLDAQTLGGKVICGVGRRCKQKGVPLVAVCGDTFDCPDGIYDLGVSAVFSINTSPLSFDIAGPLSAQNLSAVAKNIAKLLKINDK